MIPEPFSRAFGDEPGRPHVGDDVTARVDYLETSGQIRDLEVEIDGVTVAFQRVKDQRGHFNTKRMVALTDEIERRFGPEASKMADELVETIHREHWAYTEETERLVGELLWQERQRQLWMLIYRISERDNGGIRLGDEARWLLREPLTSARDGAAS